MKEVQLVSARLLDFFAHRTPWHRRLWNIGTVLTLHEVIEYAEFCISGASPTTEGLKFVCGSARREICRDPGVEPLRAPLIERVKRLEVNRSKDVAASTLDELRQLTRRVESEYLENWQVAPRIGPTIGVEFVARALAAHLRDIGLSPDHLHRWTRRITPTLTSLSDLVSATKQMVEEMPEREFEVFIPCSAPYKKPSTSRGAVQWINAEAAKSWLQRKVPNPPNKRQQGGFLITVEQRDPWAAVRAATGIVGRADARARVARPSNEFIQVDRWSCVAGRPGIFSTSDRSRRVDIGSLYRQEAVYRFDDGLSAEIDDALELASYMESSSEGAAITGGWASIEALLIRPGDSAHSRAADHLAALVTCSLPRAEMTSLAYQHMDASPDDPLTQQLTRSDTNYEKVQLVEQHLRSDKRLTLTNGSDIAAEARVNAMIKDPGSELSRIHQYVTESLRRLYNQRNLISHSGSFRSVALAATIRTAPSLVGAGLDRIVHAQLETHGQLTAHQLVARAETELDLAGKPGGRDLASLLN